MVRHNNQLPDNLPQLQNLIKRDPESYKDEFMQQFRHFLSTMEIFYLTPDQPNKHLEDLIIFVSQVCQCYIDEQTMSFPKHLTKLLLNHSTTLDPSMRNCCCRALILLRNKHLLPPLEIMELFFKLFRCPDKALRTFLQNHIVTDIKNIHQIDKDLKLNASIQNFMYTMLKHSDSVTAKIANDIMIELFRKNLWNDAKTVNVIANVGCFSKVTKVMVASLKFFLGSDADGELIEGSDDSDNEPDLKSAIVANRVTKKTKKRQKQLASIKKLYVKSIKKKSNAATFNFSGIHLIHNPQGMAEKLFSQLQGQNERFEVKLMHLDVISRLIGIHELFLFSYYPYITRYLQPHQRQVTRILQFAAQSSHELIPGDVIEPVLKTIANNFITERNSSDVMAIGLNAVREICSRCPLSMGEDLLRDLTLYKSYKEKSVMMAARSLITLYRERLPDLLHKKDRGRPTEAQMEAKPKSYGEIITMDHIPGSEALLKNSDTIKMENSDDDDDDEDASDESDDGWVDVKQDADGKDVDDEEEVDEEDDEKGGSDAEEKSDDEEESDDDEGEEESDDEDSEDNDDDDDEEEIESTDSNEKVNDKKLVKNSGNKKVKKTIDINDKTTEATPEPIILNEKQAAQELATTRIFTDDDFKRIDMANIKKQVKNARKRPLETEKSEFVRLDDIEMIYKKRKHDKTARIESVEKGRTDREKFGYRDGRKNINCSKTNKEKTKKKNFGMMRNKARSKVKKSFRDKQQSMRKHLLKQKKMK